MYVQTCSRSHLENSQLTCEPSDNIRSIVDKGGEASSTNLIDLICHEKQADRVTKENGKEEELPGNEMQMPLGPFDLP